MILQATIAAAISAASPFRPLSADSDDALKPAVNPICGKVGHVTAGKANSVSGGVTGLPFAMGKAFTNLDAYLTHLECHAGPIGMPWWKEVRPGVYKHEKTSTNAQPEIATRTQLMERFGFTR